MLVPSLGLSVILHILMIRRTGEWRISRVSKLPGNILTRLSNSARLSASASVRPPAISFRCSLAPPEALGALDHGFRQEHGSRQPFKMDPETSAVTSVAREFVSASIP